MSEDTRWALSVREVEPGESFPSTACYGFPWLWPGRAYVAGLHDEEGSNYGSQPDRWTYHFALTRKRAEKRARRYIAKKERAERSGQEVAL